MRAGSGGQFSIQHTLQPSGGGAQIAEQNRAVIQLVILGVERRGLKQRAQAGGLKGAGHAAAAFDGVPNAANLRGVAFGDRRSQRFDAPTEIGDDRSVNLPHRGLGHDFAELSQNLGADHGLIGIEERGTSFRLVALEQLAEASALNGLSRKPSAASAISGGGSLPLMAKMRALLRLRSSAISFVPLSPGICASIRITPGRNTSLASISSAAVSVSRPCER